MNSVLFRKPWSVPYLVQDLERARFGEAVGGELFALERVDLVAEPGEADFPSGRNEEKPWSVPGYSSAACVNRGLSQVILSMGQRSGNRGLSPVIYLVFIWYLFGRNGRDRQLQAEDGESKNRRLAPPWNCSRT